MLYRNQTVQQAPPGLIGLRKKMAQIPEAGLEEDPLSRAIDLFLIALITLNVIAAMLDTVLEIYRGLFRNHLPS